MFKNSYQSGFLSIFYSVGSNPLSIWDKAVKNGHIRRVSDEDVKSLVLELSGTNVATTYITCPVKPRASLGVKLPYLVMIVKNMKKYFTFEIQIRDDKDMHRRFRVSNFQSTTKVRPFCTSMPIGLSSGWNQIQFNLADFTRRAYGTTYIETTRVQIHANVRIRRIYFADRLYTEDEMPQEFKLFLPTEKTQARDKKASIGKSQEGVARQSKASETKISLKEVAAAAATTAEPIAAQEDEIPSGAPPTPIATDISEEPIKEEEGDVAESGDVLEAAAITTEESPDEIIGAGDEEGVITEAVVEGEAPAQIETEESPPEAATAETEEPTAAPLADAPPIEEISAETAEEPAAVEAPIPEGPVEEIANAE